MGGRVAYRSAAPWTQHGAEQPGDCGFRQVGHGGKAAFHGQDNLHQELGQDSDSLFWVNPSQLPGTKCQQAAVARGEFTKPVYESKFTKLAEGMSFVNSEPDAFPGLAKQDFGGSGEVPKAPPSSGNNLFT